MKKVVLLAVAGLALASAAAYAQMHQSGGNRPPMHHGQGHMGMIHGPMMQGGMGHGGAPQGGAMPGHSSHDGMSNQPGMQPKGDTSPSSLAFNGINMKMHSAMNITFTGNADVDFVRGMIPHHQGAIDMAKTVLAFGKDPAVRRLAEEIVKAQESEIALMNEWLKKNGQ